VQSVINKKACRDYLLARADMKWPKKFTRVGKDVFEHLETQLMLTMDNFVFSHPTVGKTLSMGRKKDC
jgi:hypothetical protein